MCGTAWRGPVSCFPIVSAHRMRIAIDNVRDDEPVLNGIVRLRYVLSWKVV